MKTGKGFNRLSAILLAMLLVTESIDTTTLYVRADAYTATDAAVTRAADTGTADGAEEYITATGYVEAPGEGPAPVSHLGLSVQEAEALRIDDGQERLRASVKDVETLPAAYPCDYTDTDSLLAYLDLDLPATRNQNPYGTCWAHATTGAVELDMIKRYGAGTDIDYSEMHLIYWSLHQGSNPVLGDTGDQVLDAAHPSGYMMTGGNADMTSQTLLRRRGMAAEETLPYSAENTEAANADTLVADPAEEFLDVAHLMNHYRINLTENSDQVKQAIQEHGGVQTSIYADTKYYSSAYNSFYNASLSSTNHAVLLVGWDDDFPKEHFASAPAGDGAWLVRNSWGYAGQNQLSYYKYFWISYYDAGLLKSGTAHVFEVVPAEQGYDNQYYYDSELCLNGGFGRSDMQAANVYTVGGTRTDSADKEWLKAVTIVLDSADAPYEVKIYTNLQDATKPTSGTLAASLSGTLAFQGEYTLALPEPVLLKKGEPFSVVVTGDVAIEYSYSNMSTVKANQGESFISWGSWKDFTAYNYSNFGNFRIYALTDDVASGEEPADPDPITNLMARRDGTSAALSWNALDGAAGYTIYRGTAADAVTTKVATVSAATTTYTDSGLDSTRLYYYQVKETAEQSVSEIATLLRQLTASDVTTVSGTGTFTYDGSNRSMNATMPAGVGSVDRFYYQVITSGQTEVLTELTAGTRLSKPGTYQLGIRLEDDGAVFAQDLTGITSSAWRIVISKAVISASDFTFESATAFPYDGQPHSVKPEAPAYYTGTLSYSYAPVVEQVVDTQARSAVQPSASGTYQVYVSGTETELYAAFSNYTSTAWRFTIEAEESDDPVIIGDITNLTADRNGTDATLSWDAYDGATGYVIYRGVSADAVTTKVAEVGASVTTYTNSGLGSTKLYYYQVKEKSGKAVSAVVTVLRRLTAADVTVSGAGAFLYDGTERTMTAVLPEGVGTAKLFYYQVTIEEVTTQNSQTVTTTMRELAAGTKLVSPGIYQLGIRLQTDGDVFAKEDTVGVTSDAWRIVIDKAVVPVSDFTFESAAPFTYDGQAHAVKPAAPSYYTGTLTYSYIPVVEDVVCPENRSNMMPSASGTYQVYVSGTETDLYASFTDYTRSDWRFVIEAAGGEDPGEEPDDPAIVGDITDLVARRAGTDAVLSWDAFDDAAGYAIYRGVSADAVTIKVAETDAAKTTYTDNGLDSTRLYYYQVKETSGKAVSAVVPLLRNLAVTDVIVSGAGDFTYDGAYKTMSATLPDGVGTAEIFYYLVTIEEVTTQNSQTMTTTMQELAADKEPMLPGIYQLGIRLQTDGTVFAADEKVITDEAWRITIKKAAGENPGDEPGADPQELDFGDVLQEDIDAFGFQTPDEVPQGIWVAGVPETVPYTGAAIRFDDLRVYDHLKRLTEQDYTLVYKANVNAGTATVAVTGKGNYTETLQKTFRITKLDIGAAQAQGTLAVEELYLAATGKALTPKFAVTWNGIALKQDKDYRLILPEGGILTARTEPYEITLDASESTNFTGKAVGYLHVYDTSNTEKINLSKAVVSKIPAQTYRAGGFTQLEQLVTSKGAPIAFVVKVGGQTLSASDYTVSFVNADRIGTASLILRAAEDSAYTGMKVIPFKIAGLTAKNAFVVKPIPNQTYTGKAIVLGEQLQVADRAGNLLQEGTDYTVSYKANTKAGTAKVTITGNPTAGYTGGVTQSFRIERYVLTYDRNRPADSSCVITYDEAPAYTKGTTTPAVSVQVRDGEKLRTLVAGTDYTVKYKNNKKVNDTGVIVVTGKGNFTTPKGGIELRFTIGSKALSAVPDIVAADKVYKNAPNLYKTKLVLTDANGKKLAAGTDYEKAIEYLYAADTLIQYKESKTSVVTLTRAAGDAVQPQDILPAGTVIRAVITGKNSYTGTAQTTFRIVEKDLSKAKVTVRAQMYTGAAVQPAADALNPAAGDVVVKIGNELLVEGRDFEITGYANNIQKGKAATLTIRGLGNYGGSKTVKFTILQRPFSAR
ncbi:MAG: hypothetical protein IJ747_02400 [Lachnospiraceae bacterium]|nr:hypothetical protein [Lachnospiraceae bacterium]